MGSLTVLSGLGHFVDGLSDGLEGPLDFLHLMNFLCLFLHQSFYLQVLCQNFFADTVVVLVNDPFELLAAQGLLEHLFHARAKAVLHRVLLVAIRCQSYNRALFPRRPQKLPLDLLNFL